MFSVIFSLKPGSWCWLNFCPRKSEKLNRAPNFFHGIYGYELVVTDDHLNNQKGVDWPFMRGNKSCLKTFVDENFVNDEENLCMEKWLYPVLSIKQLLLSALSSKSILHFKLYATELLKPFRQNTKWYAPYTMGSSVNTWTVCYTVTACSPCTHLNALFSK